MILRPVILVALLGTLVTFQACGVSGDKHDKSFDDEAGHIHAHDEPSVSHAHPHDHAHGGQGHLHERAYSEFVHIDDMHFKLSPEIASNGETHMDLFIRDEAKRVVISDAEILLHLIGPDGKKATYPLHTEPGADHYHAKILLDKPGDYQAVAQVTIGDKKYNPRFSFHH